MNALLPLEHHRFLECGRTWSNVVPFCNYFVVPIKRLSRLKCAMVSVKRRFCTFSTLEPPTRLQCGKNCLNLSQSATASKTNSVIERKVCDWGRVRSWLPFGGSVETTRKPRDKPLVPLLAVQKMSVFIVSTIA